MFKLFKNLKPMAWILIVILVLVTCQAVAELYLPQKMSEIIDDGIYLDYESLYKYESMEKPSILGDVDDESSISGYDSDTIPVFEMVDGFTTYDISAALKIVDPTGSYNMVFVDTPVADSKELFDDVMTPFIDGLKNYQKKDADFASDDSVTGYTDDERAEISAIINSLIYFELVDPAEPTGAVYAGSIAVDSGSLSVNDLLDVDDDESAGSMLADDDFRKILTACIYCMKHSEYGNLTPIPVDMEENRLATDEYGQAINQDELIYIYATYEVDNGDGTTSTIDLYDSSDSETGRPEMMPDYELIICSEVLGYAYKYDGDKWIDAELGTTDDEAMTDASNANLALLYKELITDNIGTAEDPGEFYGYSQEALFEIYADLRAITNISAGSLYAENTIMLENLLNAQNSNETRILKLINQYVNEEVSSFNTFFIKLGNYLTLTPTGTAVAAAEEAAANDEANLVSYSIVTYYDMKLPDGATIQTKDLNYILTRGGYMILLTIAACFCAVCAAKCSAKVTSEFAAGIRSRIFGKVETFSLNEFDKYSNASLITRSTNDINQIQTVFLLILRTALIAPITLIGGFILAGQLSVPMTLTICYAIPILVIACVVAAKIVFPMFVAIQQKIDRLTLVMRESLTGIRVVRAFNQQDRERARFQKINASVTKTATTVNKYCALMAPIISVVMNCVMVGIVWVASSQIAYDGVYTMWGMTFVSDISVGDMMAVIQYITQIMTAMVMLATVFVMFPRASASAERVNEVMATELSILDAETPNHNFTTVGSVEFKNVNFKYSTGAENYILKDITFHAQKGKVTAIVGGTGSGKSSVINLIPRFYDIQEGEILVDGVNIKEIEQKVLREKIGFVPQRSVLFSGTIRTNLLYGKEDASEDDIWDTLRIAQSDTFVREKDGGLESRVEQGGGNFSGGQKQRVAIARAVIRRP
ncbi:MAG: ABC transporter ATP-binding protein, partial [Bacillota bacterium]